MGVLKVLINISDYLLTAITWLVLSDVLYQLSFHLFHYKFLEELPLWECFWNFSPDVSKFVSIMSISKKAIAWAVSKWIS